MTDSLRLLVVEDNLSLVANLFDYFEARGHVLDAAPDGATGLHLAMRHEYDAIILDWGLPRLDGLELLRRLREQANGRVPVIMLTARSELDEKLAGFRNGADDYLTKPFALPELEARLHAVLARSREVAGQHVLRVADLTLDLATFEARRAGQPLSLNPACRKLIEALMRASPAVVSRAALERALWGDAPPEADLLRSHMHLLRRVVDTPPQDKLIHTVHRAGYRLARAQDRQDG